jgi:hypothetical protein
MKAVGRVTVGILPDLMALGGLGLVTEGCRRIYLPAAFIVAGLGIFVIGGLAARRGM